MRESVVSRLGISHFLAGTILAISLHALAPDAFAQENTTAEQAKKPSSPKQTESVSEDIAASPSSSSPVSAEEGETESPAAAPSDTRAASADDATPRDEPPLSQDAAVEPVLANEAETTATVDAKQDVPTSETQQSDPPVTATTENDTFKPTPERIPEPPKELRIATWSGAYGAAQRQAVFDPFAKSSGIAVRTLVHTGGRALLKSGADTDALNWDIADVPYHVAEAACRTGALAKIDKERVTDSSGAKLDQSDFLPEAFGACALGGSVWSAVVAYDKDRFENALPTRLEDFFDTTEFAGKRGLMRNPRYVLEMALLADGVSPSQVYDLLETEEGLQRAFRKLDSIRNDIVWMNSARQPVSLLNSSQVAMAIGFSGRFFLETAGRDTSIKLLWDGQIYDLDVWVIPKGTTHMQTALKFLSFAIQPDVMAHQASVLPYGPARTSAARKVERHASLDVDLSEYVPTAPQNFNRAMRIDEVWWQKHEERLIARFRDWIDSTTPVTEN